MSLKCCEGGVSDGNRLRTLYQHAKVRLDTLSTVQRIAREDKQMLKIMLKQSYPQDYARYQTDKKKKCKEIAYAPVPEGIHPGTSRQPKPTKKEKGQEAKLTNEESEKRSRRKGEKGEAEKGGSSEDEGKTVAGRGAREAAGAGAEEDSGRSSAAAEEAETRLDGICAGRKRME